MIMGQFFSEYYGVKQAKTEPGQEDLNQINGNENYKGFKVKERK